MTAPSKGGSAVPPPTPHREEEAPDDDAKDEKKTEAEAPKSEPARPAAAAAPAAPRADANEKYERIKRQEIYLSKLKECTMAELLKYSKQGNIKDVARRKKQELIEPIIQEKAKQKRLLFVESVLEILAEGFGFLRSAKDNHH